MKEGDAQVSGPSGPNLASDTHGMQPHAFGKDPYDVPDDDSGQSMVSRSMAPPSTKSQKQMVQQVSEKYMFVRHAQSTANVADTENGLDSWSDTTLFDAELSPYGV